MHGPVGPTVKASETSLTVHVNGVRMSAANAFSLGVNIPELGISEYGPFGEEYGKRGDGLIVCKTCGYQLCSCVREPFKVQWSKPADPAHVPELGEGECCMGCVRGETCFKQPTAECPPAYEPGGRPNYMRLDGGMCCLGWMGDLGHRTDCPKLHAEKRAELRAVSHQVPWNQPTRPVVMPDLTHATVTPAGEAMGLTPEKVANLARRLDRNGLGEGAQLFNVPESLYPFAGTTL